MPELHQWTLLCLLGGWVALDGTSWGQFMVSRPLVAATMAGTIVGAPAEAAQLGLVLEALQLRVLPVGAARYPEGGPAAIVGGAASGVLTGATGLLTAVLFVLFWEWVGGESIRRLRQQNTALAVGGGLDPVELERLHYAAVSRDFLRGVLLVVAGIPLLLGLVAAAEPLLAGYGSASGLLVTGATVAALAAASRMFGVARLKFAFAGAALGLVVVVAG